MVCTVKEHGFWLGLCNPAAVGVILVLCVQSGPCDGLLSCQAASHGLSPRALHWEGEYGEILQPDRSSLVKSQRSLASHILSSGCLVESHVYPDCPSQGETDIYSPYPFSLLVSLVLWGFFDLKKCAENASSKTSTGTLKYLDLAIWIRANQNVYVYFFILAFLWSKDVMGA